MPSVNFSQLIHYQARLPNSIKVKIGKSKEGGLWVEVLSLPGCFTQAENGEELFVMVNDVVFTYFDIPENYFPFLPRYFPNEQIKKKIQNWDKCIPIKLPRQPMTITFTQEVAP